LQADGVVVAAHYFVVDKSLGHQLPPTLRYQKVVDPHAMHLRVLLHGGMRFAEGVDEAVREEFGEVAAFAQRAAGYFLLAFLLIKHSITILHQLHEHLSVFKFVNIDFAVGYV